MEISERLQMVIKMNGMTNAAFADTIGVQRSSISHVLSGRNKPSIDFIQKILESFPKVDANWLVAGRKVGKTEEQPAIEESPVEVKDEDRAPYEGQNTKVETFRKEDLSNKPKSIKKIIIYYDDNTYEEVGSAIDQ